MIINVSKKDTIIGLNGKHYFIDNIAFDGSWITASSYSDTKTFLPRQLKEDQPGILLEV